MENLFSLQYGVAGVCVLLTIMILVQVGKFLWSLKEKKESVSDRQVGELIERCKKLEDRIGNCEKLIADLPKFRTDMRRFYAAVKDIAGDRWPKIRDDIMRDDFTL